MESTPRRFATESQLTVVDNPEEDVDHVREDVQSKVSKPLVSLHLPVRSPNGPYECITNHGAHCFT